MSNHEYIKSLCLLGSDRHQIELDKLDQEVAGLVEASSDKEPAEKILHALTLNYFYRLAGSELPIFDKAISHTPIQEEKDFAPNEYYSILKQILDIEKQQLQSPLILSWIKKLLKHNYIVHPIYLVKYLNVILRTNKSIKEMAAPTFGKKGAWLCQQNPKYDTLSGHVEEDIWSFGTTQQRQEQLELLLVKEPQSALKLLQESWESESSKEKLKHLKLILQNPDSSLLGFVTELYEQEYAYSNNESATHRNCRNILAKFLLLYGETNLHRTTVSHLDNYSASKKKGFLVSVLQSKGELLNIPDIEDAFFSKQQMLETYGIHVDSTRASDFKTDQVFWLSELCEAIPISAWAVILNAKPKQILKEFLEADKFQIVNNNIKVPGLEGPLVNLASRIKDDNFTILLLDNIKKRETAITLLSQLSPQAWETYLLDNLNLIDTQVLKEWPHSAEAMWSLPFSKKLLSYTIDYLNNNKIQFDYMLGLRIAEHIHTDIEQHLMRLNNDKAPSSKLYSYWKSHIFDPIYQTITIKNQIHKL